MTQLHGPPLTLFPEDHRERGKKQTTCLEALHTWLSARMSSPLLIFETKLRNLDFWNLGSLSAAKRSARARVFWSAASLSTVRVPAAVAASISSTVFPNSAAQAPPGSCRSWNSSAQAPPGCCCKSKRKTVFQYSRPGTQEIQAKDRVMNQLKK
jgi:hypothetical protein